MFLRIEVDAGGYIRAGGTRTVVHRETLGLHQSFVCSPTLDDVKPTLVDPAQCVLELREDGGGAAIWMRDDQRELLEPRLNIWRTCYGGWPHRRMNP